MMHQVRAYAVVADTSSLDLRSQTAAPATNLCRLEGLFALSSQPCLNTVCISR